MVAGVIATFLLWLMLLPQWLMLLPLSTFVLADVIAMVADVITTQGVWGCLVGVKANCGWCNYHWSAIYFRFSSEMLNRTSSQMCGRWYMPIFLFRDGLFALMYKASLMVLKRLWSSLPKMVKLSIVTLWPEMLTWSCMGDGALRCSLYLSSKFLADSPIYSSSQSTLSHLYLYMTLYMAKACLTAKNIVLFWRKYQR